MAIPIKVSRNFQTLKILSIFAVVTGHYFKNLEVLWAPVTLGLFVFAYSSAYFTTIKYGEKFDKRQYWLNKVSRVLTELVITNIFLLILLVFQGEKGIFCWQTIVNFFGLTGFLNWFRIENPSPLGKGLWFLTLLWIFYAVYPFVVRWFRVRYTACILAFIFFICAYCMSRYIVVGHALFFTANAFVFGIFTAKTKMVSYRISLLILTSSFLAMILLNFVISFKMINFILIFSFSASLVICLEYIDIHPFIHKVGGYFSDCILQIYLIHSYFFLHLSDQVLIDFAISLIMICLISKILKNICLKIHLSEV